MRSFHFHHNEVVYIRIEKIKKDLAKLEKQRDELLRAIAVYERCKDEPIGEYPESAYRAYIITGAVADAAKALNDAGQKNGRKKFESNDISRTIDNVEIDDEELMAVARYLLRNGRYHMDKLFN